MRSAVTFLPTLQALQSPVLPVSQDAAQRDARLDTKPGGLASSDGVEAGAEVRARLSDDLLEETLGLRRHQMVEGAAAP